ncbi:MAG TPA: LD-carboxypeptidase [Chryseolinea sp.]|nr:LD-carboxypeptidase [Chryseolinea sp.]HPM31345.1 LD-carboxypeptidase [Chryseolinea sp.]
MNKPPYLKPGDTVGIVAPGRKVTLSEIQYAINILKSCGLHVVLAKNVFSSDHSYLAGTDDQRLSDVQSILDDKSINAIVCARGGYGSTRILDQLDFTSFLKNPKWIAGFSDITAFHLKLSKLNVASIHSTMPILFSQMESADSIESLRRTLLGDPQSFLVNPHPLNRIGNASGQLIGGNLSLVLDSMGTSSEPDLDEKILIIEEVDEYLYKLDRMMVQLKRTGKLEKLSGLVVGYMTSIKDTTLAFGESAEVIIGHHTSSYHFPIAFNFPIGHENPNLAWIHGATVQLDVSESKSALTYL